MKKHRPTTPTTVIGNPKKRFTFRKISFIHDCSRWFTTLNETSANEKYRTLSEKRAYATWGTHPTKTSLSFLAKILVRQKRLKTQTHKLLGDRYVICIFEEKLIFFILYDEI
jgi:hypothetical protein